MNNRDIAAAFEEVADILEFQDANPFRVRAYRNAARKIEDLPQSLASLVDDPDKSLTDIEGIGKDLADKIESLIKTGNLPMLEDLRKEIPETVLHMLRVPGLGPKKAAALYKELSITSLDMLRVACQAHQVRELKGFGAKTEETILAGLDLAERADERMYWAEADLIVQELLDWMRKVTKKGRMEVAGSYRRGCETVGDIDLLVESADDAKVMDHFAKFPNMKDVIGRGETKMSIRLSSGLQIDLRVVPKKSFGAALQYFTGSKAHNVILRGRAKDRGLKINEYGVFRISDKEADDSPTAGKYIGGKTEEEVYEAMDLPCFPPEIREARNEFQWAAEGKLPELITIEDIQGDLHMHTTATDGKATLEEMIAAAKERGLTYIAITDHSQRVSMARGLDPKRLRAQWKEIDRLNKKSEGFLVLKGIECDILEKGGMDLPDDVLAEADWVNASLHYGQNQPRAKITERILQALENPHVDVIAHPTGRLINQRNPYDVDLDQVFAAAKKYGKFLELNSNPARLDLDDVQCAAAREHGIPIVISTDAHSRQGLDVVRYGILQARRAGLSKKDVVNTRPWKQIAKLIERC
jgi:DNA polymerase (family 10)